MAQLVHTRRVVHKTTLCLVQKLLSLSWSRGHIMCTFIQSVSFSACAVECCQDSPAAKYTLLHPVLLAIELVLGGVLEKHPVDWLAKLQRVHLHFSGDTLHQAGKLDKLSSFSAAAALPCCAGVA